MSGGASTVKVSDLCFFLMKNFFSVTENFELHCYELRFYDARMNRDGQHLSVFFV